MEGAEGSRMQTQDVVNWLKLFAVSFVVIALARTWFEQSAFGGVRNYDSIAFFAFIVAIAIATAQFVLAPKPYSARTAPAAMIPAAPALPAVAYVPSAPRTVVSKPAVVKRSTKKAKKRRSK